MKAILSVLFVVLSCIAADAQPPKLNSYPAANAVIFLDFDGQYVQGTAWNWDGPIDAQASGLSSAAITEIFNRVAEDYRVFKLNITTDSNVYVSAPATKRNRIIITPTYQWYGQAGGVSYIGAFSWGDDTPGWVFSGLLNNNIKYIAEAVSHEAGHTLGLQHQSNYDGNCTKTAEYSQGQGTGEISWAPIMGVGYYKNITTWYYGPNAFGCSNLQNDLEVIAGSPNNIGLRNDDHGNSHQQATMINVIANNFQVNGLINTSADKDVFLVNINTATNFKLNAYPQNVGSSNAGANIDIRVSLLNSEGIELSRYNPSELLSAGIDTTLNAAIYYLVVEGVGNANLDDYGSLGFYTISGSLAGTLALHELKLSGAVNREKHQLNWSYKTDETIRSVELESSSDGLHFSSLTVLESTSRSFSWQPLEFGNTWYRIKVNTVLGAGTYFSNIISLRSPYGKGLFLQSNVVQQEILLSSDKECVWQLLNQNGSLMQQGRLIKGMNRLPISTIAKGLFVIKVVKNDEIYSFKIIKQ